MKTTNEIDVNMMFITKKFYHLSPQLQLPESERFIESFRCAYATHRIVQGILLLTD